MCSEFITVMYHFVADAEKTPWPKLISRRTAAFRGQLDYLCANYEPVTLADVRAFCLESASLPRKGFLLTFDHGTVDHFENVLPDLTKRGLEGTFFAYTQVQQEGLICSIDKQRYLEYMFEDYTELLRKFAEHVLRACPQLVRRDVEPSVENLLEAREYLKPYSFYSDGERFFRRLRDRLIPPPVFTEVISSMFEEVFGDEVSFARTHYLTWEHLAAMRDAGMQIGGHGHRHLSMANTPLEGQIADVEQNVACLRDHLGIEVDSFALPNGAYNADTLSAFRRAGVRLAFTTNPDTGLKRDAPLEIGRVDTNGLPTGA